MDIKKIAFLIFLCSLAFCIGDHLNCTGDLQYCTPCGTCAPTCVKGEFQLKPYMNCTEGCVCEYGYIIDETGTCIPIEKCRGVPLCRYLFYKYEEYLTCGPACTPHCTKGQITIPTCRPCCTPGCFCLEGYIRNDDNGWCIPINDCIRSG